MAGRKKKEIENKPSKSQDGRFRVFLSILARRFCASLNIQVHIGFLYRCFQWVYWFSAATGLVYLSCQHCSETSALWAKKGVDPRFGVWRAGCRWSAFDLWLCLPRVSSNNTNHQPTNRLQTQQWHGQCVRPSSRGMMHARFLFCKVSTAVHKRRSHHFLRIWRVPSKLLFRREITIIALLRWALWGHKATTSPIKRRLLCTLYWRHCSTPRGGPWLRAWHPKPPCMTFRKCRAAGGSRTCSWLAISAFRFRLRFLPLFFFRNRFWPGSRCIKRN